MDEILQSRGAVPLVVVTLVGQGASVRQLQIALRTLQRQDRRLFVDTENNRLGGRIDIKPDHIGGFHPSCPAMGRASNVFIRCQNVGSWGTGLRAAGPDPAMTNSIATLIMRFFNSKEFLPGNPSNTSPLPGLPDRYPGMSWSAARWRPFAQARSSPDRSCGFARSPCDRLRFSIARA